MSENIIACEDFEVGYAGSPPIVRALTFALETGSSMLIIGHNGSGKTTLIRTLLGLLAPMSGSAVVGGLDVRKTTPQQQIINGVRYLSQGTQGFNWLTLEANSCLLSRLYALAPPEPTSRGVLRSSELIGSLSVGERRLELLRMLSAANPRLYLLDEPFAGVDPAAREEIMVWMEDQKTRGCSFVIIEQQFRELLSLLHYTLIIRNRLMVFYDRSTAVTESILANTFL